MPKKKVLVVLYPDCIEFEIKLALEILSPTCDITSCTPDGQMHKGSSGLNYQPDCDYQTALAEHYDCVLVPGGDVGTVVDNVELQQLLQKANKHGSLVAAICAGPFLLARAGILVGRSHTNAAIYPREVVSVWDGSRFLKQPLVVDGSVITALPEAFIDFAIAIGQRMGCFKNNEQAERTRRYYKGVNNRDWSLVGAADGG
ncbi:DJ-1/PfpI family protein [Parendozoicomonas haliclonae]|uniref:Transcriptional activator FtrA n=1 Tax=Parendozoicomonas haliclonae TaxID=1960125 RepID=A0A1X7AR86_9GAMM|nr:DJ-1/PfpI family protein [Parendozoicomonas haliclonae]SMA50745.1 transcriptional activator FtrA [Parendozoicomonas haliclonae]